MNLDTRENQLCHSYGLRSVDPVERYATKRYHIGTNKDSTTASSHPTLRTLLLLKGEGMLGSYSNPFNLGCKGFSQLMYANIFFE